MIEFYSKLKEEYVLAFINTDKGWLAFSLFCSSILAIYLLILLKKKNRNKLFVFGAILFLGFYVLLGASFMILLILLPRTFVLLMSILIIGFVLVFGPTGLIEYYKKEKLPKPWWTRLRKNNQ